MKMKRAPWLALLLGLVMQGILFISPAQAHTQLVGEYPNSNGKFASLPARVTLQFNEKLQTFSSKNINFIIVTDSHGREVDLKNSMVRGARMTISLGKSHELGFFKVEYRVVSIDGHLVTGSYRFFVKGAHKVP